MTRTPDQIRKSLLSVIERADASLAKFAERFSQDPLYALQWSTDVFDFAGEKFAAESILYTLNFNDERSDEKRVSDAIEHATREVVAGARTPGRSTSPASNLAHEAKVRGFAQMLGVLTTGF